MTKVMQVAYYDKRCVNDYCPVAGERLVPAQWQQLAPLHGSYGYDVIATIGWQRQRARQTYKETHQLVSPHVQLSLSQVRYLYTYHYLPLLACHERSHRQKLDKVADNQGLILTLDGLAPQGGEPQLWLVRELRTGYTIRSGWMSEQSQTAFENFLRPIVETNWWIQAVMSDKQRGLVPAVKELFPKAAYTYCQSHYFGNLAAPISVADEGFKVSFRKMVREEIGELVRLEEVESKGVLLVTGMLPTPLADKPLASAATDPPCQTESKTELLPTLEGSDNEVSEIMAEKMKGLDERQTVLPSRVVGIENEALLPEVTVAPHVDEPTTTNLSSQTAAHESTLPPVDDEQGQVKSDKQLERQEIETQLKRRIRYLLTLKGRPPFCLAGLEMYRRLDEVRECLDEMLDSDHSPLLQALKDGLDNTLDTVKSDVQILAQAEEWLYAISATLDPDNIPDRSAGQVERDLTDYLTSLVEPALEQPILATFLTHILKTTRSYYGGLFHSYDIPDLPRTNNQRESEFRQLNQQLLRTTGQRGATRRLLQRSGAWELVGRPLSLAETTDAISVVDQFSYEEERERVRLHRQRFSLHTRSPSIAAKQLEVLKARWKQLAPT